jgi:hypothetical protein
VATPTAADRRAFERVAGAAAGDVAALPGPVLAALQPALDAAHAEIAKGIGAYLATIDDPSVRYTAREYKTTLRFLKPAFATIAGMAKAIASGADRFGRGRPRSRGTSTEQLAATGHDAMPALKVSPAVARALAKQHRANAAASMAGLSDEIRSDARRRRRRQGIDRAARHPARSTRIRRSSSGAERLGVGDRAKRIAGHAKRIARMVSRRARPPGWVASSRPRRRTPTRSRSATRSTPRPK